MELKHTIPEIFIRNMNSSSKQQNVAETEKTTQALDSPLLWMKKNKTKSKDKKYSTSISAWGNPLICNPN